MNNVRKQRLMIVIFFMLGLSITVALVTYALRHNINLFYSPTQVVNGVAPVGHSFRLGGLVKRGSVVHDQKGLAVVFKITDTVKEVSVSYTGILPDLFSENKGVIVQGKLNKNRAFIASQVLAKHDENYMPPPVKDMLNNSRKSS